MKVNELIQRLKEVENQDLEIVIGNRVPDNILSGNCILHAGDGQGDFYWLWGDVDYSEENTSGLRYEKHCPTSPLREKIEKDKKEMFKNDRGLTDKEMEEYLRWITKFYDDKEECDKQLQSEPECASCVTVVCQEKERLTQEAAQMIKFFGYKHLPVHLKEISKPFCEMALGLIESPMTFELLICLRKLLDAQDCSVRSALLS